MTKTVKLSRAGDDYTYTGTNGSVYRVRNVGQFRASVEGTSMHWQTSVNDKVQEGLSGRTLSEVRRRLAQYA